MKSRDDVVQYHICVAEGDKMVMGEPARGQCTRRSRICRQPRLDMRRQG